METLVRPRVNLIQKWLHGEVFPDTTCTRSARAHTHTRFSALRAKGAEKQQCSRSNDNESWFLITFSNKRNRGFLEEWPTLGLGKEIHKMRLEHLVPPVSKKVLKMKTSKQNATMVDEPTAGDPGERGPSLWSMAAPCTVCKPPAPLKHPVPLFKGKAN